MTAVEPAAMPPPPETAAARTARRQSATQIRGPEDNIPSRSLSGEQNSAPGDGVAVEETKMAITVRYVRSRRWTKKQTTSSTRISGDRYEDRLRYDDRGQGCSKYESNLRRDGLIGKQWKRVEQEDPQWYRAACSSSIKDIWVDTMGREV